MIVRTASIEDARSLAQVHVASWSAAYRGMLPRSLLSGFTVEMWEQKFRELLDEGASRTALIEDGDRVLGYTTIGSCRDSDKREKNCGEVWGLYIAPDNWGRGLGLNLTRWALEELRAKGYVVVTLWVFEENRHARRFYESLGFAADGSRERVIPDAPAMLRYCKHFAE